MNILMYVYVCVACWCDVELKIQPGGHGYGYRWFSVGLDKVYQPVNVYQLNSNVD